MSDDTMSMREFELSVRTLNAILAWKPDATLGDVRTAFERNDMTLHSRLRSRDRRDIRELLLLYPEPISKPGLFDHITGDRVRAERERTGNGMISCKHEMQREALLNHIDTADEVDVRFVLRWLVERGRSQC